MLTGVWQTTPVANTNGTHELLVQKSMSSMLPRITPTHPLPGELSVLEDISTLHFRKSPVSSAVDSIPQVFPDTLEHQGMSGNSGLGDLGSTQTSLLGSDLTGLGSKSLLAANSGLDVESLLNGGLTIPAWKETKDTATPRPSRFNKYSKVGACMEPN